MATLSALLRVWVGEGERVEGEWKEGRRKKGGGVSVSLNAQTQAEGDILHLCFPLW